MHDLYYIYLSTAVTFIIVRSAKSPSAFAIGRDLTMEVATSVPNSTAFQQGGKLFDLPRELRDEIYRYTVTREYDFPNRGHTITRCGILFVSKRIRDEALELLYSEGTFRIDLRFHEEEAKWLSSRGVPQRIMNIELDVNPQQHTSRSHMESKREIWKETLRCISRTNTIRKTLRIRCRLCSSNLSNPMPEWMYLGLASMTRFRTVIVELPRDLYFKSENYPRVKSEQMFEDLEHKMEAIEEYLRPALGPAALQPRYGRGYHWQTRTLTFHPQKHLSKNTLVLRLEKMSTV